MDPWEKRFRELFGDSLTERILLQTSQIYDYPFWMKEVASCKCDPETAYLVGWREKEMSLLRES